MELIKMTDFVLKQSKRIMNFEITHLESHEEIVDYAKFLKQEFNMGMFIPCNEIGKILKEPSLVPSKELEEYRKAKEKVLFKNFIKVGEKHVELLSKEQLLTIGIGFKNGIYKTIEDLANNFTIIELTDSATKQFLTK